MDKVEAEPSRKAKEVLLRDADDHTLEAIRFATDTFITFGITVDMASVGAVDNELAMGDALIFGAPKVVNRSTASPMMWWIHGFKIMADLAARTLTGHAAHREVIGWLRSSPSTDDTRWACRVLNKDLRCGVSAETVAKLWPTLIEPFRVSLAHPYDADKHTLGPGWIEPKLDGMRMVVIDGKAYTRNGNQLDNVGHILDALAACGVTKDWVWDGECLDPNMTFEETVGALKKVGGRSGNLIFHPFDVIDRESWRARKTLSTDQRKADLVELAWRFANVQSVRPIIGRRVVAPSFGELTAARDAFMEGGLEGAMYKAADAPYQFKRSNAVLKIKQFHTMDVRIVDVLEGSGKLEGTLGAFVVSIDDVQFNVGSGFTDHERRELWALSDDLIGKTVEVRYQNKTAKGKGRFPTYVRMRYDK